MSLSVVLDTSYCDNDGVLMLCPVIGCNVVWLTIYLQLLQFVLGWLTFYHQGNLIIRRALFAYDFCTLFVIDIVTDLSALVYSIFIICILCTGLSLWHYCAWRIRSCERFRSFQDRSHAEVTEGKDETCCLALYIDTLHICDTLFVWTMSVCVISKW